MLTCIPRPKDRELNPPRGPVHPICDHFEDINGRATLSIWIDHGCPSLKPLFSYQVYVTSDASPAKTSDREAFANQLRHHILGTSPIGEGVADIMESHRALVQAEHTKDLAKVVMPFTDPIYYSYKSVVFIVSSPDWKQEDLTGLSVDPCSDSSAPLCKEDLVEYSQMFNDARDLRMTEWQEVFNAAKRMGMLQI
ncbi:hypothetical protein IWZ03DRAFT_363896 [Phyllosticta citriasiana]|uniref:Uncharacterized protein n=1 Tax=Phyllosticta citriasiana TaxID=595635 RepID=A0ABR1K7U9_9PEZI